MLHFIYAACTLLIHGIAATPLLVTAACGIDEWLTGRHINYPYNMAFVNNLLVRQHS